MLQSPTLDLIRGLIDDSEPIDYRFDGPVSQYGDVEKALQRDKLIIDEQAVKCLASWLRPSDCYEDGLVLRPSLLKVELPLLHHAHDDYMLRLTTRNVNKPFTAEHAESMLEDIPAVPRAWTDVQHADYEYLIRKGQLQLNEETTLYLAGQLRAWQGNEEDAKHCELTNKVELEITTPVLEAETEVMATDEGSSLLLPLTTGTKMQFATQQEVQPSDNWQVQEALMDERQSSSYFRQAQLFRWKVNSPVSTQANEQRTSIECLMDVCSSESYRGDYNMDTDWHTVQTTPRLAKDRVAAQRAAGNGSKLDSITHICCPPPPGHTIGQAWQGYYMADAAVNTLPLTKTQRHWAGIAKLERKLRWRPVPASHACFSPHVGLDSFETIGIEDYLHASNTHVFLADQMTIIDKSTMTEALKPQQNTSLPTRMIWQSNKLVPTKRLHGNPQSETVLKRHARSCIDIAQQTKVSDLAARHELSSFLELHSIPIRPMRDIAAPRKVGHCKSQQAVEAVSRLSALESQVECSSPAMVSTIEAWHKDCQIVVGPHVITQKDLIQHLELRLPRLRIVERAVLPSVAGRSGQQDADISISASVGIMLTTLQKLKQKPLPGQSQYRTLPRSIVNIAKHYQRIVILVRTLGPLQEDDCVALAELAAGTTVSGIEIINIHVSSDEILAAHICREIRQHHTNDVQLSSEETRHERLLRVLGLNAYAAQILLSQPIYSAVQGYVDKSRSKTSIVHALSQLTDQFRDIQTTCGPSRVQSRFARGWFG